MTNDITILSCPICNNPKLRKYGNGIYQCDVCETYFDKDENVVLTEQEWLQTCTTEQLAEFIIKAMLFYDNAGITVLEAIKNAVEDKENLDSYFMERVVEWLKQPHTPKE